MKKIYVTIVLLSCLGGNLHAYGEEKEAAQPYAPDILSALIEAIATNRRHQTIELFRLIIGEASIDQIRDCLQRDANVNAQDMDGNTPLHAAALSGRSDLANLLLGHRAEVNAQDAEGNTPLHAAARLGRRNLANLLLERGAEVNAQDARGNTPLHQALKSYLGHMYEDDRREQTRETVLALLDHQADPTIQDDLGCMPSDWVVDIDEEFKALMDEAIRAHRQRIEESTQ